MKVRLVSAAILFLISCTLHAGVLARFRMNADLGTIDVELFEKDKPVTVSNFVAYVKAGKWHDTQIHRWHKDFVIQGGFYQMPHHPQLMTPFTGGGDRTLITRFPEIPFEADSGRRYNNTFGTLSMARGSGTNTASSDWFFNLADSTFLDTPPGYTVFGRTVRGTNILNKFNTPSDPKLFTVTDPSLPQGSFVPIYSVDGQNGFWVNVDVTLLTVQIARVRNFNEISWDSVEGVPNIVEYTKAYPPVWQTLQTVTGTGATMTANDASADAWRHYRVRIDFGN
jgi:cyclophilin family peptidyl-prolyl cis-trans isomerase